MTDEMPVSTYINGRDINAHLAMQLATSHHDQPWICTVYFVVYQGCFYWLSFPDRRHSGELADNLRAAVAVVLKYDIPVAGIQVEGDVHIVQTIAEVEAVLDWYVEKYSQGQRFIELFKAGKNKHVLYCLRPRKAMLFDERRQPDIPPSEVIIT